MMQRLDKDGFPLPTRNDVIDTIQGRLLCYLINNLHEYRPNSPPDSNYRFSHFDLNTGIFTFSFEHSDGEFEISLTLQKHVLDDINSFKCNNDINLNE